DPRKTIEWYRDVLGLDVAYIGPSDSNPDPSVQGTAESPGHWVELGPARPRTRVHLCFMRGETEPGPSGITFITDDIQADYERMRRQGVELPLPPELRQDEALVHPSAAVRRVDLEGPLVASERLVEFPEASERVPLVVPRDLIRGIDLDRRVEAPQRVDEPTEFREGVPFVQPGDLVVRVDVERGVDRPQGLVVPAEQDEGGPLPVPGDFCPGHARANRGNRAI